MCVGDGNFNQAVKDLVKELDIRALFHFTQVANLPSILTHGIYPVSQAQENGLMPIVNDELRLDGHLDGISLSLGHPNYRMFYKYRHANANFKWAVLAIHPSVLWLNDCAFCRHNAADGRISCQPLHQLKTIESFAGMFEELEGHQTRKEQRLKKCDPTDVQAEVLAFDIIRPEKIMGAVFNDAEAKDSYIGFFGNRKVIYQPSQGFFSSRDYVR